MRRRRAPDLPDAMRAAMADASREPEFLRALHAATVLVPQPDGPAATGGVALPVVERDGRRVLPVYTSEQALQHAHPQGMAYVAIRMADLQARWRDGVALAIDPGGELGTVLADVDVRALPDRARVRPVHVGAGEEFAVGEPREDVSALRAALADHLAAVPAVRAAHLALVAFPGHPAQLVLGLVLVPGADVPEVARGLPDAPTPHPLSAVAIDPDAPDALGAALLEHPDLLAS